MDNYNNTMKNKMVILSKCILSLELQLIQLKKEFNDLRLSYLKGGQK